MKTYRVEKEKLDDTQMAADRARAFVPPSKRHGTTEELEFIKSLAHPSRPKPMHSIRAYREALEKRADWTGIDRAAVFSYIDRLLEGGKKAA